MEGVVVGVISRLIVPAMPETIVTSLDNLESSWAVVAAELLTAT